MNVYEQIYDLIKNKKVYASSCAPRESLPANPRLVGPDLKVVKFLNISLNRF